MKTNELLNEVKKLRSEFSHENDEKMKELVNQLASMGVYQHTPHTLKMEKRGRENSFFEMVKSYGERWHEYKGMLECPHCKTDFRDKDNGPPFKLEIGVVDRHRDCVSHYQCAKCGKKIIRNS